MQLYLVQHGAAKSAEEDPERSLTAEGRQTVERTAEHLSLLGVSLGRIEHSDKLRARQTAEILATRLRPRQGTRQVAGLAPRDDVEPVRARLAGETTNVMLVGHLPFLSKLVSRLLGVEENRALIQFQMGGAVRIDRDDTDLWGIRWVLPPEAIPVAR